LSVQISASTSRTAGPSIFTYQPITESGEGIDFKGPYPLILMLAVLPTLFMLGMNLRGDFPKAGDASRLASLCHGSSPDSRASAACSRSGKRDLACSTQADVATLAVFLDANHPRAVAPEPMARTYPSPPLRPPDLLSAALTTVASPHFVPPHRARLVANGKEHAKE
jgi:hypothetical protein